MSTIIRVERFLFSPNSTVSKCVIDGRLMYFLEDKDRGLKDSMTLTEINAKKIFAVTAIPEGRYEVIINMSNRFKKLMPLLLKVKGFEGIRIHAGNTAADTEGCLIAGFKYSTDFVGDSRLAYSFLFNYLESQLKKGKVFIEIGAVGTLRNTPESIV